MYHKTKIRMSGFANMRRIKDHSYVFLIIILLAAFFLRLYRLDYQSLRGDEAFSALTSGNDLAQILRISQGDPHPPLYYILLHFWMLLAGNSEFSLRYFSVIPSLLSLPLVYLLSRKLARGPAVYLAVIILTVNPLHIWYAQDARAYALLTFLSLAAVWFYRRYVYTNSRRLLAAYIMLMILGIYSHYYAAFILLATGLWSFLRRRFAFLLPWLASSAIISAAVLPWLFFSWQFIAQYKGSFSRASVLTGFLRIIGGLTCGHSVAQSMAIGVAAAVMIMLVIGCLRLWKSDDGRLVLLYFFLPLLAMFLMAFLRSVFNERYFILIVPPFCLIIASTFIYLQKRLSRKKVLSICILVIIGLAWLGVTLFSLRNYYFDPAFAKAPPWRLMGGYLEEKYKEGDVMITNYPEPAAGYYHPREMPFQVIPSGKGAGAEEITRSLEKAARTYKRLWLLPLTNKAWDRQGLTPSWLERYTERVHQVFFPSYNLNLYFSPAEAQRLMTPQAVDFAAGMRLEGYRVWTGDNGKSLDPKQGKKLEVSLHWLSLGATAEPYTVFVHLVGPDGQVYGQWDNPPVGGSYPTTEWTKEELVFDRYTFTVAKNAPPGEYRLRVGLYKSSNGERSEVRGEIGASDGTFAELSLPIVLQ